VVDKSTNAKLKVSFFWPFRGDYWIIELGKDYEYAVVSSPNRKYLWILSRTPKMDEALYARIVEGLRERGFDVSLLQRTEQGNRKD
jgi:apolipoprotein D and lipocalin family protein